nr:hypothetical protein [Phytohabitans houttuyneae]
MYASATKATRRAWIGLAILALPTLLLSLDVSVLYLALPSSAPTWAPPAPSSCGSWTSTRSCSPASWSRWVPSATASAAAGCC